MPRRAASASLPRAGPAGVDGLLCRLGARWLFSLGRALAGRVAHDTSAPRPPSTRLAHGVIPGKSVVVSDRAERGSLRAGNKTRGASKRWCSSLHGVSRQAKTTPESRRSVGCSAAPRVYPFGEGEGDGERGREGTHDQLIFPAWSWRACKAAAALGLSPRFMTVRDLDFETG